MKKSIQEKKHHGHRAAAAKAAALATPPSSWKRWAILSLCLLAAAGGAWAIMEYVVWNVVPTQLVGKWVVTEGPQEGATFDFFRNGKMVGRVNQGGKLGIVHATIRLEGQAILSTSKHPRTGEEMTLVQHIRTLTSTQLVVEDDHGTRLTMARAD